MIKILKEYSKEDIKQTEKKIFKNNELQIKPLKLYEEIIKEYGTDIISHIAVKYALYNIPTLELIEFLKQHITKNSIEVGSGNGIMAKALNIKATDNKCQLKPEIAFTYTLCGQNPVQYGEHVEKLEALEAVKKYNPDVVLGSWVTDKNNIKIGDGINEEEILNKTAKYIFIGNKKTHCKKTILKYKHETINMPLISRIGLEDNIIWIWNNNL